MLFNRTGSVKYISLLLFFLCLCESKSWGDVIVTNSISTELRYNSNPNYVANDERASDDFVLLISPQIELLSEHRKFNLNGFYRPTASFYYNNTELNGISHYVTMGILTKLSLKTNIQVNEVMNFERGNFDASQVVGIQHSGMSIWSNTTSLRLNHEISSKSTIIMNLSDSITRYEDITSVDSRVDIVGISSSHNISDSTSITSSYTFSTYRFILPSSTTQIENHSLSLGFSHAMSSSLNIAFWSGVVYVPGVNNYYDWVASTNLRKSFEKSAVNIGYARGNSTTSGLSNLLNINETYSIEYSYTPTRLYSIDLYGNYYENNTKPIRVVSISSYIVGVSGSWRPYEWMGIRMGYSHFEQSSNRTLGRNLMADNVFLSVTITGHPSRF